MMLFDIIRDWFVMYIWGGISSNGDYYRFWLGDFTNEEWTFGTLQNDNLYIPIGNNLSDDNIIYTHMSFSDWLSTTSTIIVLILMCIFLFICVRYLFKVGAGLFSNLRG